MNVVYCIDSLCSSGGTERVLTTKINWLAKKNGINVAIVTLKEQEHPFFTFSEAIKVIKLEKTDTKQYKINLSAALKVLKPDVVIAVAGMAVNVLPTLNDGSKKILEFHYTKNFLVNFVNGLHSVKFKRLHLLKMHWLQWQLSQTSKKYDAFVGLTQRDVRLWGNPKNMTYIYNPLSFRSEKKSSCESHKIIAVGSFTPAKGMDQLIHAFGAIAHKYPDWILDIYGQGQDKEFMKSLVCKYNIDKQVNIYEPVSNISDKLIEASIYAFPSRSDGFGLVITEAMECGLPTVAFDCECGPREIVSPNTGVVVPDKDIDAFSQALEKLITNENLRKSMGAAAVLEVRRFYCDSIMPKWIELFTKIINR